MRAIRRDRGHCQQELRSVSAPLARPRPQLPRHVVPGTYTSADDGHSLSWHDPDTLAHIGLDLRPAMVAPWLLGCPGTVWHRPVSAARRGCERPDRMAGPGTC